METFREKQYAKARQGYSRTPGTSSWDAFIFLFLIHQGPCPHIHGVLGSIQSRESSDASIANSTLTNLVSVIVEPCRDGKVVFAAPSRELGDEEAIRQHPVAK
jgi:hypothetical protein